MPCAGGRVAIGSYIYTLDLQRRGDPASARHNPRAQGGCHEPAPRCACHRAVCPDIPVRQRAGAELSEPARPHHRAVRGRQRVDTLADFLGNKLTEQFGQPVVVENRASAGGNLAPDALAKAAPDGYSILLTTNGLAISPALYRTLPFDVHKDFVPVTQVVASQLVIAAHPKLPATRSPN